MSRLASALLLLASTASAQSPPCQDVEPGLPRRAEAPEVLRITVPPTRAPTHGTAGMAGHFRIEIENLTDAWLRVELIELAWVAADRRAPMTRASLAIVGRDGRRHVGRALTIAPRYRGSLDLQGDLRPGDVRYHVTQWHEARLRVGATELAISGCGLWFRYPHRRR